MGSSGFMRNLKSKPFPKQTSSFWSEMIRAWITHLLACDKPLQFLMWSIWLILSVASTSSIQSYISRKPSNFLSIALCVVAQPHGLERIRQQLLNSMLCLRQHAQYTQTIPSQYAVDHEFTACTSGWFWQIHLPMNTNKADSPHSKLSCQVAKYPTAPSFASVSMSWRCFASSIQQTQQTSTQYAKLEEALEEASRYECVKDSIGTLSTSNAFSFSDSAQLQQVWRPCCWCWLWALKHGAMWNWNWEWNSEWITEWYFINNVSKSKPSKSYFMTCNFSTVCSEAFESLWSCYTVLRNISQPKFPEQSTCPKSQFSQPSDFIPADFGSDEMTLTSLLSPAAFALLCSSLLFSLLHVMLHTYAVCHPNSLNSKT